MKRLADEAVRAGTAVIQDSEEFMKLGCSVKYEGSQVFLC